MMIDLGTRWYWPVFLLPILLYLYFCGKEYSTWSLWRIDQLVPCAAASVTNYSTQTESASRYAVFSCSTPSGTSLREFDYAFFLPLTALAWQRVGYQSIVVIVGSEAEWREHTVLAHVLGALDRLDNVTVLYLDAPVVHRVMLSQTVRLFVAHLAGTPANGRDYLITSDADLWPLMRSHFQPRQDFELTLWHSHCCGSFVRNNVKYRMLPMGHIGARVETWRQIIDMTGHGNSSLTWQSIVDYLEEELGPTVREQVVFASKNWYHDQRLISIRIDQWMRRYPDHKVFEVSDQIYERIDRSSWNADKLNTTQFAQQFDSHLLESAYRPLRWLLTRRLVHLMYGKASPTSQWVHNYTLHFRKRMKDNGLVRENGISKWL